MTTRNLEPGTIILYHFEWRKSKKMIKSIAKDTLLYGLSRVALTFIGFLLLPLYASILTVTDYGIMSLVATVTGITATVINFGMNNAVQRFYYDAPEKERSAVLSTSFFGLLGLGAIIIAVALLLVIPFAGTVEARYGIKPIYILYGMLAVLPGALVSFLTDIFRLQFSPKKYFILSLFSGFSGLLIGLFLLVVMKRGLLSVYEGSLIGIVLSLFVGFYLAKGNIKPVFDAGLFKKLFLFGFPFIFANLSFWVFASADKWMLAEMASTAETGVYNIGRTFAGGVSLINTALGMAWAPYVFKMLGTDKNYRKKIVKISEAVFVMAISMFALVAFFSFELIHIMLKPEYWPAADSAVILSAGLVFSITHQFTALGISFEKKSYLISVGWVITALLNVVLNLLLIPGYGSAGASAATLASFFVLTVYYYYYSQKLHPMPYNLKTLSISGLIVILITGAAVILNHLPWTPILLAVKVLLVGGILYSVIFFNLFDHKAVINEFAFLKKNKLVRRIFR